MPGKGILAMDESNATCGSRLEGVGVENIEENRRRYRELLITTPNLGEHIGGAILFEETLYQSCADGTSFVDALNAQGIYPGIKVDKVRGNLPPFLFSTAPTSELRNDAPLSFEDFSLSEISWLHELPS
jgi:fructose-bisphosphate aldolase class 1